MDKIHKTCKFDIFTLCGLNAHKKFLGKILIRIENSVLYIEICIKVQSVRLNFQSY